MKKLTIAGMILMLLLAGCKTKTTEEQEIQKLLDRQVLLQESQSEAVDQLQQIRDSLLGEKQALIQQRTLKDEKIQRLEKNQQTLAEQLREEEESDVASEKETLAANIAAYEDSIRQLKDEMSGLNSNLDSIEKSIDFYEIQESRTDEKLESGISEIDSRMSMRETRKQQELKRADLLRKRILIAEKKIEAYQLERQMYADEMDDLLRINAAGKELEPYRERIAEMDSIIDAETENRRELESEVSEIEKWVAETDAAMEELQAQIKQEYDKKAVLENFIVSEKERLNRDLENIETERQNLISKQEKISQDLADSEARIASLNKRIELIRNREMSEILEQLAAIEETEASLAEEEIRLLEEGPGAAVTAGNVPDSLSDELSTVLSMNSQLDSLNDLIQEEKAEIARTRKALSEKRAETAMQRARFGRTMGITIFVIVLGGVALLVLFYFLGRRARNSKKA